MKDGQSGVTPAYRAHDRMSDGMVAAKAYQWIARLQCAPHVPLNEIPGIGDTIELDIAMIHDSACGTQIDARFAPHAMRVRVQIAADKCWRFSGTFHEMGVIVVRDSQKGNFYQFVISYVASGALLTGSDWLDLPNSASRSREGAVTRNVGLSP